MWLVVGLGNPGPVYELSRHNVGFQVIDGLADRHGVKLDSHRYGSLWGRAWIGGEEVFLVKPEMYMNHSGVAVQAWLSSLEISPSRVVVVHDDLDLPLGRLRVRKGGGDGGHRGVRSIMAELGSGDFLRVKVGIGRPPKEGFAVEHVLEPFPEPEALAIAAALSQAREAVEVLIGEGLEAAMNRFNVRPGKREGHSERAILSSSETINNREKEV